MSFFFGWSSPLTKIISPILMHTLEGLENNSTEHWKLNRIYAGDISYLRLIFRYKFPKNIKNHKAIYLPAFHLFDEVCEENSSDECANFHNHRIPSIILPFGENLERGKPLYQMPWEFRVDETTLFSGEYTVRTLTPYGFSKPLSFWHAVKGLCPHMSFNLADVSKPPRRENRLKFETCSERELKETIARISELKAELFDSTHPSTQEE